MACGILVSGSGIESMPTAFWALSFNPWITREVLKLFIGEYRHVTPQLKTFQGPSKALRMKPKVITGIHVAQKDPLTPHSNLTSLLCCSSHHCLCCTSCLQPLTFIPTVPSARKAGKTQIIMVFQGSAWMLPFHRRLPGLNKSKVALYWDFPGGPVVKTVLPWQGGQVQSMMGELKSPMPRGEAKKMKK